MCLIAKSPVPKTAKRNFTVYKVLYINNNYAGKGFTRMMAPVRGTTCYLFDQVYNEPRFNDPKYEAVVKMDELSGFSRTDSRWKVSYGYHSCKNRRRAREMKKILENTHIISGYTIVECTIPKGSQYFEGCKGDICSNSIIINRIIE